MNRCAFFARVLKKISARRRTNKFNNNSGRMMHSKQNDTQNDGFKFCPGNRPHELTRTLKIFQQETVRQYRSIAAAALSSSNITLLRIRRHIRPPDIMTTTWSRQSIIARILATLVAPVFAFSSTTAERQGLPPELCALPTAPLYVGHVGLAAQAFRNLVGAAMPTLDTRHAIG